MRLRIFTLILSTDPTQTDAKTVHQEPPFTYGLRHRLSRTGFVFTDLDTGVRVTARGPKTPADPGNDGERDTVVKAQRNGDVLERSSHRSRGTAARRYVELVDEYG